MPHMNEPNFVFLLPQGFEDSIDAVSGKAKDRVHSPCEQAFHEHIGCIHHSNLSRLRTYALTPADLTWFLDPNRSRAN